MTVPGLILLLGALGFIGFGAAYAVGPFRMGALTDLSLPTPTARVDFSATYGGFQIGFGLFLLLCALRADWVEPGLWAAALALAGFGVIRGLGILTSRGRVRRTIWFGLCLELLGVALSAWGLSILRSGTP